MKALILVDIQNDFVKGGSLAVPAGEEVVNVANVIKAEIDFDIVVATQDWHPANHGSFASTNNKPVFSMGELGGLPQVMWPDHCVQGTKGADFVDGLDLHGVTIFRKGTDPQIDSYSGFFDNGKKKSTGLSVYLRNLGITELFIMGLATDYCVKATALDAVAEGFKVHLLLKGCRGVNMKPTDSDDAIKEMQAAGVQLHITMRSVAALQSVAIFSDPALQDSLLRGLDDFESGRGEVHSIKGSAPKTVE